MPKVKIEYDEDGRWVEERGRIKGAIRKAFRLAPQMKEVLEEARVELPPALKKDGTPGKRPQVRYRCAMCGELFPMAKQKSRGVQVDHIETVVPLHKSESKMPFDEWVYTIARGIFCSKDNLQVLCSLPATKNDGKVSCHRKKTNEENYIRREMAKIGVDDTWYPDAISKLAEELKVKYYKELVEKEAKKNAKKRRKRKK